MNISQFNPFKQYSFLRRFDLQPHIRERKPVVKRDPTVFLLTAYLMAFTVIPQLTSDPANEFFG